MVQSIDIEVLLAGAYAVLLILIALSLELIARYSHVRSEKMRIAGFRYIRQHDIWECPTGQHLRPVASDYSRRSVRYRALAHACNACSIKHLCTDSDKGREIEHNPESWLQSELARFHRGLSLTLLLLAGLLLLVEVIRHERPMELLVLGGILVPIILVGTQLALAFFASRTGSRDD
jgi:hypothetical protein